MSALSSAIFRRSGPKQELCGSTQLEQDAEAAKLDYAAFDTEMKNLHDILHTAKTGKADKAAQPQDIVATGRWRLLSLQECYELMELAGVALERYLVYSSLSRSGYLVMRYPSCWVLEGQQQQEQLQPQELQAQASCLAPQAQQHSSATQQQGHPPSGQQQEQEAQQQVQKEGKGPQPQGQGQHQSQEQQGQQVYDVYQPGVKVARAKRVFPSLHCHVAICSQAPPRLQEQRIAESEAVGPGVPIKWAAVEGGMLTMYEVGYADLIKLV
ncbi:tRNA_int_end_N2 domain-containing protein [Haematococcus lacustris]|uniref:tRNA_int_end_N2 domain-containing protein n=1 Tax=Haematococcus lacustris TaxID=44745 RepID=A0A6A0AET7_HAELA|nr:tRNA_int_end_N2 domain-containing protein [Haematococcus lacustris]